MRRIVVVVALLASAAAACSEAEDAVNELTQQPGPATTAPVLPEGACVARMQDANPGLGGTNTVIVDSHFASQPINVVAHYKSKDSAHSGALDANKHGEISFSIGQPTAGYPVSVDVTVGSGAAPDGEKCQTSFTPR